MLDITYISVFGLILTSTSGQSGQEVQEFKESLLIWGPTTIRTCSSIVFFTLPHCKEMSSECESMLDFELFWSRSSVFLILGVGGVLKF